jgi:hypothetical protein
MWKLSTTEPGPGKDPESGPGDAVGDAAGEEEYPSEVLLHDTAALGDVVGDGPGVAEVPLPVPLSWKQDAPSNAARTSQGLASGSNRVELVYIDSMRLALGAGKQTSG